VKDELFARLRRVRREEPPASAQAGELPDWFRARAQRNGGAGGAPGSPAPPAGLVELENGRGRFACRLEVFSLEHAHGDWQLGEALAADSAELAWLARDPALASLSLADAVYLDIETTGLSGGAGTIPFLVALGTFRAGRFELWQAFLRGPEEEAAALVEVAERIRAHAGLVSFFGKAFDRHRLEDKMRLHGIAPPFGTRGAPRPHLDLYHPLARVYRAAYGNGRLSTFERELCSVERGADLPGSLAPAQWFDYLAGRPHRLEQVFRHNALDVLSLVTLAAHLARVRSEARPDGRALAGCSSARARAIAQLHAGQREYAAALEWIERALTRPGSDEGELWFRRAELLRKAGQRERALLAFLRLAREREDALGSRAWGEVRRLARRLRLSALEEEARAELAAP
jgi:hypothetical protein